MLCGVIRGETIEELAAQCAEASSLVDLIEVRFDQIPLDLWKEVFPLVRACPLPSIFTLRSVAHGGNYAGEEPRALLMQLAGENPSYLDLEYPVEPAFLSSLKRQFPKVKHIVSLHNLQETPSSLKETFVSLRAVPADLYKLATFAQTTADSLRMLSLIKKQSQQVPLVGVCLGRKGHPTRLLGRIFGNSWTYCTLNSSETSEALLSAEELLQRYRYRTHSCSTAVYGLLGDPVDRSPSDRTHNAAFAACGLDAVYVKLPVSCEELLSVFPLLWQLPFRGVSVTTPLKEVLFPHLDQVDEDAKKIGAVNTCSWREGAVWGTNTDGPGGVSAIEEQLSLKGAHVALLGAGGAARALAYFLPRAGALVDLYNRTLSKAEAIEGKNVRAFSLAQLTSSRSYDLVIDATSSFMQGDMPLAEEHFPSLNYAMDLPSSPQMSPFLKAAMRKGALPIFGRRLFLHQALLQFEQWFGTKCDMRSASRAMEAQLLLIGTRVWRRE